MKRQENIVSIPNRSLASVTVLVFILFAVLIFLFYSQRVKQQSTNRWVIHTEEVLRLTTKIMSSVIDNETGARGFVITAKPSFLEPLEISKITIHRQIDQLQELTKDRADNQADIDSLIFYANKRISFSDSTILLRKESGLQAAAQLVSTGRGKSETDNIRRIISHIEQKELNLLQQRKTEADKANNRMHLAGRLIILVVVIMLCFFLRKNRLHAAAAKAARDKLKQNEELFRMMVSNIKDYAIFLINTNGQVESWNSGAEYIKGYKAADIIGKPIDIFYTKEDLQLDIPKKNLQQALSLGHYESEGWRVRKDGTLFWADVVFTPLLDENGVLYGYAKVTRDITEKKKAADRISLLATIANNIEDPIITTNQEGLITRWNKAAELLLEWTAEELVGKLTTEVLKIDYLGLSRKLILESLETMNYWHGEIIYHAKSGRPVNVWITASQLKDGEGKILGNLAVVRDITERKQAEVKLKEFEHFFNNSNDFNCIANTDGYFEIVNASFNTILGYAQNELATRPFIDFVHPEDIDLTLQAYSQLKEGATVIHFINRYRKADGSYVWFDWNATPNLISGKLYCIARDITERKKAEDELNQLNEELEQKVQERTEEINKNANRFRALLENNNDVISLMDEQFQVIYRSPSASRITGWKDEELLNEDGTKNIHPEDREKAAGIVKELMTNPGKTIYTLFRNQHREGHYLWVEGTVTNLLQDENVKAIVFNYRDVTERIDWEAKLAASEMRFRMLIENSAEGIDMSDELSNNIYRSPGAAKITGNLPKRNQMLLTHPDDLEHIQMKQEEMIKNPGIPVPFQARFRHAKGHYLWLEGTLTNLLHVNGVNAFVTNFRDVTERKKLEVLLHKANTLARMGGWEIDMLKGTVFWSDITREIHETADDYVPDLYNGINFYKEGTDRDLIFQKVKEAIDLGKPWDVELQIVTAKNNERWIRSIGETEFVDGKCIRIYGSFQDIDERKKVEIERERLSERLQLATHSAQLGLWDWDVKNNTLIWDEGMYRLYNISENEFSSVYEGWASRLHPEDRQRVDHDIQSALLNNRNYDPEFRVIWKDSSVHYIKASGLIEKDNEGNVVRMTGFNWDITERKAAEEKIRNMNSLLEEKVLERTEQLRKLNEEMEAFSYSVSHDLRAPLRGIIGFTNILEEDYANKLDDEARRITGVIKNNTVKMGNLIDDLLSFSRLGRQQITKTNVHTNEMISAVIADPLAKKYPTQITWIIPPLADMQADAKTIKQVWTNLISNAQKYSAKQQQPVIEIGCLQDESEQVFFVRDNGVGFDEKYSDKLFKVFQRLHSGAEFEGTGVGLAIVEKIVDRHGGRVWATGQPGKGACFYFSLPLEKVIN